MSVADGFHWFVYGYGNLERLGEYYLANFDSPIISSLIAVISQGVYCWRIHHLSRWRISPFIIAFVSGVLARNDFEGSIMTKDIMLSSRRGIWYWYCGMLSYTNCLTRRLKACAIIRIRNLEPSKIGKIGTTFSWSSVFYSFSTTSFWNNSIESSGRFVML